jgi:hypothetical protein
MLRDYDDFNWTPNNSSISISSMPAFNEQEEVKAERSRKRRQGIEVLDVTGNDLKVILNTYIHILFTLTTLNH